MNNYKEFFDAIKIIVEDVVNKESTKVFSCIIKSVNGNKANIMLNGKENTVVFYGDSPTVGKEYRVFVPGNNMSNAFIIVS